MGTVTTTNIIWQLNSVDSQSNAFLEGQIGYYANYSHSLSIDLQTNGGRGFIALDDFNVIPAACRGQWFPWQ
jgi:hypothetical protein